jgi:hypothetical protein
LFVRVAAAAMLAGVRRPVNIVVQDNNFITSAFAGAKARRMPVEWAEMAWLPTKRVRLRRARSCPSYV